MKIIASTYFHKNNYVIATLLLNLLCPTAFAQLEDNSNSFIEQIDPGRIGEYLILPQNPGRPIESSVVQVPTKNNPQINERYYHIRFHLKKIVLRGNTTFSTEILQKIYQSKLDQQITAAELKLITHDITTFYRNAGYILTQVVIPAQEVDDRGIINLQIIEGYVGEIAIEGSENPRVSNLLTSYGKKITASKPLRLAVLERYTLLANDIPGASVRAVLTNSPTKHGAAKLTFVVKEKAISGNIGVNNYNSSFFGREQLFAGIYANNTVTVGQTGFSAALSSNIKRINFIALQHKQQLNDDGLGANISLSKTKAKPNLATLGLAAVDLPGQSLMLAANTYYPLIRSRRQNLVIGGGFKFLNSDTKFANSPVFEDSLRSVNLKLDYDVKDNWYSINRLAIGYSHGLNILDAKADPPSRQGGKTDFSKLKFYAARYQQLLNTNFLLMLAVDSQYAFSELLSAETFGYGGASFGYGYNTSVITGDHGIAGRAELQYQINIQKLTINKLHLFAFYDRGSVWNINKALQPTSQTAAATGTGIRLGTQQDINLEFVLAKPLNDEITHASSGNVVLYLSLRVGIP